MTWTQPKTWTSEPLTSADLNTHLRDNLEALKDPPSAHYAPQETTDYTTTSLAWVDVDSAGLSLTIETHGGDVLVSFHGVVFGTELAFDVAVDGVRLGGDNGLVLHVDGSNAGSVAFTRLVSGLSAGSHTFALQWRTRFAGITLYAGAGTANRDHIPQFWVREVS